jgi:Predicted N-acetylglucosamine kinase
MTALLAIDAGGTSSRAVVLDESGRCLGYGRAGGGNPISSGPERAAAAVVAATRDALAQAADALGSEGGSGVPGTGPVPGAAPAAGVPSSDGGRHVTTGPFDLAGPLDLTGPLDSTGPLDLAVGLIAMAGARTYVSTDWITTELEPLGLTGTVVIESDLLATFCSAGPELDGYAIVAGTGAAAVRVRDGVVVGAADGLGWLLGDAGSGYWIGHAVVLAAVSALDGRAPGTALVPLLLDALDIPQTADRTRDGRAQVLADAVDRLYSLRPIQLAEFAPLAFAAAADGDTIATHILAEAERSIVETLAAVTDAAVDGPVVLGGGVLARLDALPGQIAASQHALGHDPDVRQVADGTVGAAVLALRAAGIPVDREVFDTIVESLGALR